MSESAQIIDDLVKELKARNAPLTTENLNRVSLARAQQRREGDPLVLNLEGEDRVGERTRRVVGQPRAADTSRTARTSTGGEADTRRSPANSGNGRASREESRPAAPATPTGRNASTPARPAAATPASPTDIPLAVATREEANLPTPPIDLTGDNYRTPVGERDQPAPMVEGPKPDSSKDNGLDPDNPGYSGMDKRAAQFRDTMRDAPQGAAEAKAQAFAAQPTDPAELARLAEVDPPIRGAMSPLDLVGGVPAMLRGGMATIGGVGNLLGAVGRTMRGREDVPTAPDVNIGIPPAVPRPMPTGPRPVAIDRVNPSSAHPSIVQGAGRPVAPGIPGGPSAPSPASAATSPEASQGELLSILQSFTRPRPSTSVPSAPSPTPTPAQPQRLAPAQYGPTARPAGGGTMEPSAPNPYRLQSSPNNPTGSPATSVAQGPVTPAQPQPANMPPAPAGTGGPQFGPPAPQGMTPGMIQRQAEMAANAPRMQPPGPVSTPQMPPRAAPIPQMMPQAQSEVVRRIATMLMQRGTPRADALAQAMREVQRRGGG